MHSGSLLAQGNDSLLVDTLKAQELDEATVVASRIVRNADGYVISLRGSDITRGHLTSDVLGWLPDVIEDNGSYKINNLTVSEIYVDGIKISDDKELKAIPANAIDNIRIKYLNDISKKASQAGGSIWITLKKPKEVGYYASLAGKTTAARRQGLNDGILSGFLKGRYKKWSYYDYAYWRVLKYHEWRDQTVFAEGETTELKEVTTSHSNYYSNRFSLAYDFNEKNTLAASYFVALQNYRPVADTQEGSLLSSIVSPEKTAVQEGTIKYTSQLNEKDANFTLITDYYHRSNKVDNQYTGAGNVDRNHVDNVQNLWREEAELSLPINDKHTWRRAPACSSSNRAIRPPFSSRPTVSVWPVTPRWQTVSRRSCFSRCKVCWAS